MKKTTVLAVSLVVVAVALAVWFGREQPADEQIGSPVAETLVPVQPSVEPASADDLITEPQAERPTASVSADDDAESDSPTELFGEPSSFSIPYMNAQERSVAHITEMQKEVPVTQTRILQSNKDATSRFIANVLESPARFDEPVEVEVFPGDVCSLSSVEHVNQTTVPGDLIITGHCDSRSNRSVYIEFDADMETLTFSIVEGQISYRIVPMRDTGFSLAMKMDYRSLGDITF